MVDLVHLRSRLFGRPLLVTGAYASVAASVLADRLGVEPLAGRETIASYVRPRRARLSVSTVLNAPAGRYSRPGRDLSFDPRTGIAILPIVGSMVHRGDGLEAYSGVQSYTSLQRDIGALVDSPKVRAILLDLDTPGGEAAGLPEIVDFVRSASAEKPIWGIANTSACSGGYWLGAACTKLLAAPMASVGSIGVVVLHTDISKMIEKRGLVLTLIFAGSHKVDGNPYAPLPDDVRASVQAAVDSLYDVFTGSVASLRGVDVETVRATEAAVFDPADALKIGLVDGLATLGQALALLAADLDGPPVKPAPAVTPLAAILALPESRGRELAAATLARREPALSLATCAGLLRALPPDHEPVTAATTAPEPSLEEKRRAERLEEIRRIGRR